MTLWHNPEVDKPQTDRTVICLISGKIGNVTYKNAFCLGEYFDDSDNWLFSEIDPEDTDLVKCVLWTDLPRIPKEFKEE